MEPSIIEVVVAGDSGPPLRIMAFESFDAPILRDDAGGAGDHTGQMVWAGAHSMLTYLTTRREELRESLVFDLGIGAGLTTVMAARHARYVVGTDVSPDALRLATSNCALNGVESRATLACFDWTGVDASTQLCRHLEEARVSAGCLSVVGIAAEIVYPSTTSASLAALFQCVESALRLTPHSYFAMSYVQRRASTTQLMLEHAWQAGLVWLLVPIETLEGKTSGTQIFRFALRTSGNTTARSAAELQASTLPLLLGQVESERTARLEAEEEAASFVLPAPFDD